MAEDLERFTECPVCFERLIPPVETCLNGHAVCQKCRITMDKCPTCRDRFSNNKNTLLNQMLESIPVSCKNKEFGCKVETPVKIMKEHEKNCYFREEKCSYCHSKFVYNKIDKHFKDHFLPEKGIKTNFSRNYSIDISLKQTGSSFVITHLTDENIYFLHRFLKNMEQKTLTFALLYLGKREDACKYYFDVKFNQNYSTTEKKFLTVTGYCIPYFYVDADWQTNRRAIALKMDTIFLSDKYPEVCSAMFSIHRKDF